MQLGYGPGGSRRLGLCQTCHSGERLLADSDGVRIEIVQA
jgi:hypothetical protein